MAWFGTNLKNHLGPTPNVSSIQNTIYYRGMTKLPYNNMHIHTSQCIVSRVTSLYVKVKEKEGSGKRKIRDTWGKRAFCFVFS